MDESEDGTTDEMVPLAVGDRLTFDMVERIDGVWANTTITIVIQEIRNGSVVLNSTEGDEYLGSHEQTNGVIAWALMSGLTYSGVEELDVPGMGTISTLMYRDLANEVYNISFNVVVIDDVVLNIAFERTWGSNMSRAMLMDTNIPAIEAMFE